MNKEYVMYALIALLVGVLGTILIVGVVTKHRSQTTSEVTMTPGSGSPRDYQRRIAEGNTIVAQNPKNVQAWIMLGNDYYDTDQPRKSIDAYAKALELKPNDTNVLTDQGTMFRRLGMYTRALANFEKAQKIDPTHLQSLYNIGIVYRDDLNQPKKAIAAWTRYLKLDSTSPAAQQIQAQLVQMKASLKGKK